MDERIIKFLRPCLDPYLAQLLRVNNPYEVTRSTWQMFYTKSLFVKQEFW
jgi:hypothetical protein